jgi:hypothetical protein
MSATSRLSERDLRKKLLQLEAQICRLEIAADLRRLRKPMTHLRQLPVLFGAFGGKTGALRALVATFAGRRLGWVVKAIPLALAGMRLAKSLRAKRRRRL